MHQHGKHINRDSTLRWNKMSTQQQDQHWNAGATEAQQLNTGEPDQRQSIKSQDFKQEPSLSPRPDLPACN